MTIFKQEVLVAAVRHHRWIEVNWWGCWCMASYWNVPLYCSYEHTPY